MKRLIPVLWTPGLLALAVVVAGAASVAAGEPGPAPASGDSQSPAPDWAFKPLTRPALPHFEGPPSRDSNPIDAFIRARLAEKAFAPSPEADKRTLIRRVFFDLIGLPPGPEEVDAFLADEAPDAYGRLVDGLLASPRYGERWARHWMDAAHFAETHGNDQDRIRTNAWPYRDYLVASFNADKPYARFVQEQVAGDVLFPDDPQATVALGFVAAGPWDESSLRDIREDTIDRQIGRYLDRDDMVTTVMQTFTSTTVQCARCHDHKFDPIPQRDYYALQAVFAGVDRANRVYDADPSVHRRRQALLRDRQRAARGDRALLLAAETQREAADWEHGLGAQQAAWAVLEPQTYLSTGGATLTRQADGSLLAGGARPERDTYTITAPVSRSRVTAVRLEVLTDESLPHNGPGRQDNGNLHLSEFQLLEFEPGVAQPRELALDKPSADFNQDGWTIDHAIDGNEKTAWGIYPRVGQSHQAVFRLKTALVPPAGTTLAFVLKQLHGGGHLIGRVRLSLTDADDPAQTDILPAEITAILGVPADQRNEDQRLALAGYYLKVKTTRALAALPAPSLVYAAASEFEPDGGLKPAGGPRPVHLLRRGDIHRPADAAAPGALGCVTSLRAAFELPDPADEGARRAALARWLADANNPLTWRSIVNRVWHLHFGRGLVDTPNDFGKMGGAPSHPELLDWLATWFRDDARGSLKQLHRLIVTSATYRQTSGVDELKGSTGGGLKRLTVEGLKGTSEDTRAHSSAAATGADASTLPPFNTSTIPASAVDSDNRLLWRMNRTRLDAEQVRDTLLQVSGCLDLRMGGPGDRQFDLQPGIHVTPRVDYARFDVDSPQARRRSIYRFLFRTLPDPFMDALDCPAGDQLTPARNASVTVQQALAMWNDAFAAHYAARFAERLEGLRADPEARIVLACEFALNRPPTPAERSEFAAYTRKHGLANLCRLLLNSNEFMFVN